MPNGQPAQLANLRPPWSRGTAPRGERTRRSRDVDKAITLLRKYSPQAVKLIREVMLDESEPIAMRVKCAEILLNKAIPTSGSRGAQLTADGESGIDWLELRFVAPGAQPQTPPETLRITFDGDESVDESMGKIIDLKHNATRSKEYTMSEAEGISAKGYRGRGGRLRRPAIAGARSGAEGGRTRFGTATGVRMESDRSPYDLKISSIGIGGRPICGFIS